jgi:nitrogen fixation-related uncharacterized protein
MIRNVVFVAIIALFWGIASAQLLEDRVRELERRVEQLEKQQSDRQQPPSGAPRKATPAAPDGWRSMANWRTLKRGMTENEVRSVLGEPQKIDVGPLLTVWYYDYPRGGTVRLSSSDRRVEGWTEPRDTDK